MILAKTLFGDEGEILTEELLSRGQDCTSNLIYRATKRLALSRVNVNTDRQKETGEIINNLNTAFIEMTKCHFFGRVGSPYLLINADEKYNLEGPHIMPQLNVPTEMKYKCPGVDFKAILGNYLLAGSGSKGRNL